MELLSPHLSRWPPIKSCNITLSIAPKKQVIMWRKKVATMDLPCRPVFSNQNITKLCEGSSGIFKGIIIFFFLPSYSQYSIMAIILPEHSPISQQYSPTFNQIFIALRVHHRTTQNQLF